MFRFLSRNIIKGSWHATEEEKLIDLVVELKDYLGHDLDTVKPDPDEDNLEVLYPGFSKELQAKAKQFMGEGGYRRLCSVPSFFLGIVMLSRIPRHYIHAPWFIVATLNKMINDHGGVSEFILGKTTSLCIIVHCGIYDREHFNARAARKPKQATFEYCRSRGPSVVIHGSIL